jgi:hypothetical protein
MASSWRHHGVIMASSWRHLKMAPFPKHIERQMISCMLELRPKVRNCLQLLCKAKD